MIEPLEDYFTIAVERRYEDTTTKSGIILLNAAYIDDEEMDRFQHKRIYGRILTVPKRFSDTPYRVVDQGMPSYRKFIGHDHIIDKINRGYNNHDRREYYPSTFDKFKTLTMRDIAEQVNVNVGDKVYFVNTVTEQENFIGKINNELVYRVIISDIYCSVTDQINMQGEWVLVRPNIETWEEITTKSGIIMKPSPTAKWLEGVIAHSRHDHLHAGQRVVYLPNADCEITVEGEKLFVMPVSDIIGELKTA